MTIECASGEVIDFCAVMLAKPQCQDDTTNIFGVYFDNIGTACIANQHRSQSLAIEIDSKGVRMRLSPGSSEPGSIEV